jgi:arylsulfatase
MNKNNNNPGTKSPNILLIMPDQMRGDCLSLEGHPILETSVMDQLGRDGAHFSRGYTTCPSCIPARRSLLTGQFPATNGMVGYKEGLPIESPTLPQILTDAGYVTSLAGRYMHQSPKDEAYGFQRQTLGSTYIRDDEYARYLQEEAPELGGIRGIGLSCNGRGVMSWPSEEAHHPTSWTIRQSRRYLKDHLDERPMFHVSSFYAPHPPLFPPAPYLDKFLEKDLPDAFIGDWAVEPPEEYYRDNLDSDRVHLQGEELRQVLAAYFGLIQHIDDRLADLINEFKAKSDAMKRPWLIILTSDHGDMLGDHFLFRKCQPYEGSTRVPFLIQGSHELGFKPGVRSNSLVCLEDILPTLLESCGIEVPEGVDGKSLVPILRGDSEEVRSYLHAEHATAYSEEQAFHFITDERWKYIWRPGTGEEQLFDLSIDPGELTNLAGIKKHQNVQESFREKMIDTLKSRPEGFVRAGELVPNRPYPAILGS